MPCPLNNLPDEVWLDNILPFVEIPDLLSLSLVNRHLHDVASDNILWLRRIRCDFNVPPSVTARQDGWKELYGALRRPTLYVWGETSNSRLGLPRTHPALATFHASYNGVNAPARLELDPSVGMVDIQASGFGFVGLDSGGRIWVWGALDGTQYPRRSNPDWLHAGSISDHPRQLALTGIESIAAGRRTVIALSSDGTIWELTAWGKARKLKLEGGSPDPIAQISAGWQHSAYLSQSEFQSNIVVWFPSFAAFPDPADVETIHVFDQSGEPQGDTISITVSSEKIDPFVLPPIPSDAETKEKVVEIASGERFIVALTETGRIWTCWIGDHIDDIGSLDRGHTKAFWEEHTLFRHPNEEDGERITHVSAQFQTFFAYSVGSAHTKSPYSTSLVYKGSQNQLRFSRDDGAEPEIIPELQSRGVIKVALGDWHFAALTAQGKVLTWGQYCSGALGLRERGHGGGVDKPTQVQFGDEKDEDSKRFAFALTASGWHTGALTVDLDSSHGSKPRLAEQTNIGAPSRESSTTHSSASTFYNTTSARMAQLDPAPSRRPIPGSSSHPSTSATSSELALDEDEENLEGDLNMPGHLAWMMRGVRIGFAGRGATNMHRGSGGRGGRGNGEGASE